MHANAIEIERLSKAYRLYNSPKDRLKEALHPLKRKYHQVFHALSDITLSVPKGETYGLIGLNGSGKSTLLKLICGITQPSGGNLEVNGRISALLELGAGFNPEYTGLENIFFSCALVGFDRAETTRRLDDIINFADIGTFIEQPVKNYSSGMLVRLAFSVAIHVDPEILIIDEALAVGDVKFQHKCMSRIKEFQGSCTILFVTHDLSAIVAFCDKAVWLHQGRLMRVGQPKDVTKKYFEFTYAEEKDKPAFASGRISHAENEESFGKGQARILENRLSTESTQDAQGIMAGEKAKLTMTIKAFKRIEEPMVGFAVKNKIGLDIFVCNNIQLQHEIEALEANTEYEFSFTFTWPNVRRGSYSFSLAIGEGDLNSHHQHHWVHNAFVVECMQPLRFAGIFRLADAALNVAKK